MVAESTRSRFAMYGVVPSLIVHGFIVLGLYFTPEHESEEPPICPLQEELCHAVCDRRAIAVPERCPEYEPCRCDLVPVELVEPELFAEVVLPPEPVVPPEPPAAEPPSPAEPPLPEEVDVVVEEVSRVAPRRAARKQRADAKAAALVKVLGTYGGESEGALVDVLSGEDVNRLDDVFSEGMSTSKDLDAALGGGEGGQLRAAGGEGVAVAGDLREVRPSLAKLVRPKVRGLQKCYTRAAIEAGVEGKLELEIEVEDGKATKVEVTKDTTGDADVRACVVEKAEAWSFDSDAEGRTSFSVVFRSE